MIGLDSCVALIVPNFDFVKAEMPELKDQSNEQIIADESVKKLIRSEIDKVNKTLAGFEMVKRHALLAKPFTIEAGEMTPSMKVKRKVVKERYAAQIAGLSR